MAETVDPDALVVAAEAAQRAAKKCAGRAVSVEAHYAEAQVLMLRAVYERLGDLVGEIRALQQ